MRLDSATDLCSTAVDSWAAKVPAHKEGRPFLAQLKNAVLVTIGALITRQLCSLQLRRTPAWSCLLVNDLACFERLAAWGEAMPSVHHRLERF